MKKILFTIVLSLFAAVLMAVPARPGKFEYTQPDGTTITLMLHGDEWCHWTTDAQGRIVRMDPDGFYRVAEGVTPARLAAAANIRRQAARQMRKARGDEHIALGKKHFLVILVEFSDLSFKVNDPATAFHRLLNESGYSENGATGSARDYYYDNSHGMFEPVFDVFGPVTLPKKKAYYGENDNMGNDKHPEEAVAEGCKALDSQVDFSDYDLDGDGKVDLVFMYYAGKGEADGGGSTCIWPHQWELSSGGILLNLDGVQVDSYACSNEIDMSGKLIGIGTACHEFAHAMGVPDFYDTDYEDNGQAAGLFSFSLMDGGAYLNDGHTPPYFNTLERIMLGWVDESSVRRFTKSGPIVLPGIDENVAYMTPTDTEGEYFMYECRNSDGWDKYLSARGMLVYHIDKSSREVRIGDSYIRANILWDKWRLYNAINVNGTHPCFYIIPSSDQSNLGYGLVRYGGYLYFDDSKSPGIPFPGSKKVTTYVPVGWSGENGAISFSDISYTSGTVTFNVTVPYMLEFATISNPGGGTYRAGVPFELSLKEPSADPSASVEWSFDGYPVSGPSVTLTAGSHSIDALVTTQSGRKYTLTLEIEAK